MNLFPNIWPKDKPNVRPCSHGWLAPGTANMLKANLNANTSLVLELGAWLGKSTRHILNHAPNAKVISVDLWDAEMLKGWIENRHPHLRHVLEAGVIDTYLVNQWQWRDRLTPVQMHSHKAIQALKTAGISPDVVFLDTSHGFNETRAEVQLITSTFPSAILVGDDWLWKSARSQKRVGVDWGHPVQRAVKAFLADHPDWSVEVEGTGWVLRV